MEGEDYWDQVIGKAKPLINLKGRRRDYAKYSFPLPPVDVYYRFFEDHNSLFRGSNVPVTVINNVALDLEFIKCDHLQRRNSFNEPDYGPFMAKLFGFGDDHRWRAAREDERLHHRGVDGLICMTMEQMKVGLWIPMHRFMADLINLYLKCSVSQITPNGIRAICWFIVSCTAMGKQPTLKAFFHLFNVRMSGAKCWVIITCTTFPTAWRTGMTSFSLFPRGVGMDAQHGDEGTPL